VIRTPERIIANDQIRRRPDHTKIPFFAVDAVVEAPLGCAPHECYGAYEPMMRHMRYYVDLVNGDPVEGMRRYLDRYVYGPKSWTQFLDLIGLEDLMEAVAGGRRVHDA
jgi:glutaconate CoA-transferase subunit A